MVALLFIVPVLSVTVVIVPPVLLLMVPAFCEIVEIAPLLSTVAPAPETLTVPLTEPALLNVPPVMVTSDDKVPPDKMSIVPPVWVVPEFTVRLPAASMVKVSPLMVSVLIVWEVESVGEFAPPASMVASSAAPGALLSQFGSVEKSVFVDPFQFVDAARATSGRTAPSVRTETET